MGEGATGATGRMMTRQANRPQYLVIFRERSERNVSLLSELRKVGAAQGVRTRASQVMLEAKAPGTAPTTVFQRFGIAATDLTEDELASLQQQERVAAVTYNEVRTIPPFRPSAEIDGAALASGEAGVAPAAVSPRLAFLDGMLAAITAMRAFEGQAAGGAVAAAPALTLLPAAPAAAVRRTWGLAAVGITANYRVASGKGVKVAVLDTGINLLHPDFQGRFEEDVNAVSFVPGASVQDGHGHGTHCSGTVGGPRNTFSGIRYGVAPDVDLLIGKVLSTQGSGFDDWILNGIDWAADSGARIISMSLGSTRQQGEPFSQAYETVASTLLDEGVLIVAAAGNGSDRPDVLAPVENPAACPSILSVAAIDRFRQIADFSCPQLDDIGQLDVSAPGVAVYSAWKGRRYVVIDGTSMATPHVAGVAALHVERNPNMTARELWQLLRQRVTPLGNQADFGSGLVQVP